MTFNNFAATPNQILASNLVRAERVNLYNMLLNANKMLYFKLFISHLFVECIIYTMR